MHILFDFDGTIADTFAIASQIGLEIAGKYEVEVDISQARKVGFRQTLLNSGFPLLKVPQAFLETKKKMAERMKNAEPIKGIRPVLKKLAADHTLGIVSSNAEENITAFLLRHRLELFDFVYSGSLFGKHKVLEKVCQEYSIPKEQAVYVGDEDRDIQAARKAELRVIAVTWGFNDRELLEKQEPDAIVTSPKKLLATVKSLSS